MLCYVNFLLKLFFYQLAFAIVVLLCSLISHSCFLSNLESFHPQSVGLRLSNSGIFSIVYFRETQLFILSSVFNNLAFYLLLAAALFFVAPCAP